MRTLYTAAISALLCSLVWIGGTAKLNDEYIKVIIWIYFQFPLVLTSFREPVIKVSLSLSGS